MIDLLDVNLWVALVDKRHPYHPLAEAYWSENGMSRCAFCRITMLGFLRLCTSPTACGRMPTSPLSQSPVAAALSRSMQTSPASRA
jgi:predicted nucleic acid-binding protein